MRKTILYSAILLLIANGTSFDNAYASPTKLPVEALEQAVSRAAEKGKAGAVLDVQGCGISFRQAKGISNRKTETSMPLDEPLRIASVGKLYTAAVIHKLSQQGVLDLDSPATLYLDEGEIDGVPNADATLRQLLNHTSGVPDYYDAKSYLSKDWTLPITPEFAFKVAKRRKAKHAPGETYAYSNTNYQILGLIAEKTSGMNLTALIQSQILTPLRLNDTFYNTEHPGGTIHGYGTELRKKADTWKYAENTGADSGITATSADLSRYLKALFLKDGEMLDIGTAMQVDPVNRERERQFAGAGAEILVSRAGTELLGHTGDTFGYLTFAFAIPKYNVTLVGHTNSSNTDVFSDLLKSTALFVQEACKDQ